jgi:hypothetical protein
MIRRFKFEDEIYRTLACVPLGVRRKLDRAGIKVGLDQWKALGHGERLAVCHLPAESEEECETIRIFIGEALKRQNGTEPKVLPEEQRRESEPPASPPPQLVENARAEGVTLNQALWERLDEDQRYALMKLGGGRKRSHDLAAALAEFLGG